MAFGEQRVAATSAPSVPSTRKDRGNRHCVSNLPPTNKTNLTAGKRSGMRARQLLTFVVYSKTCYRPPKTSFTGVASHLVLSSAPARVDTITTDFKPR